MPREIRSAADPQVRFGQEMPNEYRDRLLKLIPSEIVAAFLTINGMLGNATPGNATIHWVVIAFLFVLTPIYLHFVMDVKKKGHLIISALAFIVWVMASAWPLEQIFGKPAELIGAILLILFTLLIPFFYKG